MIRVVVILGSALSPQQAALDAVCLQATIPAIHAASDTAPDVALVLRAVPLGGIEPSQDPTALVWAPSKTAQEHKAERARPEPKPGTG